MRYVGPFALLLTIVVLMVVSLATGERGYCRMVHLAAKPVGLGLIALWLLSWGRRARFETWTALQRTVWIALFVGVLGLHVYGAVAAAPSICRQPVCSEAETPAGWVACLTRQWGQ